MGVSDGQGWAGITSGQLEVNTQRRGLGLKQSSSDSCDRVSYCNSIS